ncbi:MAG: nitrilase-related carbon-nitrogen hydrolase [Sediminispirochaetaceae bacterium]
MVSVLRSGADCIIFPEYTNVFLSILPLADELDAIDSMDEGLALIQQLYGEKTGLREYFIRQSSEVRRIMDRVWGAAAARYGAWIVAGTAFAADDEGSRGSLYNRLFVYSPEGEVVYIQDKVYLTPFERDVVGVDPGRLEDAELLAIGDALCGFSICRDTFFDAWEARLGGADLWVDVKANGAEFTAETEKLFATALPERIRNTGVRYGATVCLTGGFLELFWEGRSSVVAAAPFPGGYETILEARDHIGEEVLFFTVSRAE